MKPMMFLVCVMDFVFGIAVRDKVGNVL